MITSLYAGCLCLLYFKITLETISARKRNQVSLGYGTNSEIESIVSAHANFNAYVPIFIILFYLLERSQAFPNILLHSLGILFFIGRTFHFIAFRGSKMNFKLRVKGMHLTLWPMLALAILNIFVFIKSFLN
ncbi:MAG: hypothetical protein GY909_18600 [Oligoflexia bacterium]|nr:hypothetical protein [Oligoflexia bacterium]